MRRYLIAIALLIGIFGYSQQDDRRSTIDFVEILNDNEAEALFYYQNNWKMLREKAIKRGYIHSFQLLEMAATPEAPYHLMLITTYSNKAQYDGRESHFDEIIAESKGLKLLNDKKPVDFRKILYGKDVVRHLH